MKYQEYMQSDLWKQVKEDFKKNNQFYNDTCFLCFNTEPLEYHHWRYPKRFKYDTWQNLMLVCSNCHKCIHDMKHSKVLHTSSFFPDNSYYNFVRYLTFIIKGLKLMDIAHDEYLVRQFSAAEEFINQC